jgi:phosphoribosylamine---glycine ligase
VRADDVGGIAALAGGYGADLVVVGPEAPLVAGVCDAVRAAGLRAFGPSAAAAHLEGSKAFAKEVMAAAGVATARALTVTDVDAGMSAVAELGLPVAVKADGLAAGKGVVVAQTEAEAREALEACLMDEAFGAAGSVVVVEEGMAGPEVSLLAISDGRALARFPAARDYKPIGEGNTGPNTGGMGSVSPVPDVPDALADELLDRVHRPVVAEMARRGAPFAGVLYAGLMMTADGPRVLEFNVRFGDPETQALLPRWEDDALDVLTAASEGALEEGPVRVSDEAAVAVVLAAAGYPGAPRAGDPIDGLEEAAALGAEVYHAGTAPGPGGTIVTAGGRVLAVSARGDGVARARERAYDAAELVTFEGRQMRRDIAAGLAIPEAQA